MKNNAVDLSITIDQNLKDNKVNISHYITLQIRGLMHSGVLKKGDRLPSSRLLAKEWKLARGTVVTAFEILIAEGLLESIKGSGVYVATDNLHGKVTKTSHSISTIKPVDSIKPDMIKKFTGHLNFLACRPSLEKFPRSAWRKSAAFAASILPDSDYGNPLGELHLRQMIVAYLRRSRGLDVNVDEIIITNGAINAMHILAKTYLSKDDVVAFENPGYPLARQTLSVNGAKILPINVDEDGFKVDELPKNNSKIKLVYVTPSHQFPTGERLSLQRRKQLLDWAYRNNALVLEDDYDGEFRYDIPPLAPLAAMCPMSHVVYFGTFSKTLFPGLRLGFAVAHKDIIQQMAQKRTLIDYQSNTQGQLTLAHFIENGEFEKHIHRMRRIYAKKRQCLKHAIAKYNLPGHLCGIDSGLNGLVKLSCHLSAEKIATQAKEHGVLVSPLSRYNSLTVSQTESNALILGYSTLSIEQIEQGVEILATVANQS